MISAIPTVNGLPAWILGMPLFRSYYALFDRSSHEVRLAPNRGGKCNGGGAAGFLAANGIATNTTGGGAPMVAGTTAAVAPGMSGTAAAAPPLYSLRRAAGRTNSSVEVTRTHSLRQQQLGRRT